MARAPDHRSKRWSWPPLGAVWLAGYAVFLLVPIVVLSRGFGPGSGVGPWYDFSMGLGFVALAVIGGQFLLTARIRRATAPFGVDVIYVFHRWLAVIGLLLIVGHWLILRARYPSALGPLWPPDAPGHMTAARLALLLFALLVATSLWRNRLRFEYDHWRIGHAVMSVAGVALAVVHLHGVGRYSSLIGYDVLMDLFLATLVLVVAYVRAIKPLILLRHPYRVESVHPVAPDAWTLRLRPEGHAGLRFQPGQFAWLSLGIAPWRAKEHPFSFSGSAEEEGTIEFTIKALGNFTRLVGGTEIGTVAYVDGPHGAFSPDRYPRATGFVLVAAGVGIAPMMSMIRTLADRGDDRPIWLVTGNDVESDILFREELTELEERLDLRVHHVLLDPPAEWTGHVGVPDPALLGRIAAEAPAGAHAFLSGPVVLTDMVQWVLRRGGFPMRRIHVEIFEM